MNDLLKKADIYQYYGRNEPKLSLMYRTALLTKKKKKFKRSAIKAQQILETLVRKATSAMFQNKKLKRYATSAIAEVALRFALLIALCPPL